MRDQNDKKVARALQKIAIGFISVFAFYILFAGGIILSILSGLLMFFWNLIIPLFIPDMTISFWQAMGLLISVWILQFILAKIRGKSPFYFTYHSNINLNPTQQPFQEENETDDTEIEVIESKLHKPKQLE